MDNYDTLKSVKRMINDMETIIAIQKERIEALKRQPIASVRIGDVLEEINRQNHMGLEFYFQHNLQLDKIGKLKNMKPFEGKIPAEDLLTEEEIDQINREGYKLFIHIDGKLGANRKYCSLPSGTLDLYDLDSEGIPLLYHSKIVWNDIFKSPYLEIEENKNILYHIGVEEALLCEPNENMIAGGEGSNQEKLQASFIKAALQCNDYTQRTKETQKTKK